MSSYYPFVRPLYFLVRIEYFGCWRISHFKMLIKRDSGRSRFVEYWLCVKSVGYCKAAERLLALYPQQIENPLSVRHRTLKRSTAHN